MSRASAASIASTICDRAGLAFAAERPLDVDLAERLAEIAVGGVDAALPARPLLLRAGQRLAVEREVLVHEPLRQHRARSSG